MYSEQFCAVICLKWREKKMGREEGLMVHKMHIPKITHNFTYFLETCFCIVYSIFEWIIMMQQKNWYKYWCFANLFGKTASANCNKCNWTRISLILSKFTNIRPKIKCVYSTTVMALAVVSVLMKHKRWISLCVSSSIDINKYSSVCLCVSSSHSTHTRCFFLFSPFEIHFIFVCCHSNHFDLLSFFRLHQRMFHWLAIYFANGTPVLVSYSAYDSLHRSYKNNFRIFHLFE